MYPAKPSVLGADDAVFLIERIVLLQHLILQVGEHDVPIFRVNEL